MSAAAFSTESFFPKSVFDAITQVRVQRPNVVLEEAGATLYDCALALRDLEKLGLPA